MPSFFRLRSTRKVKKTVANRRLNFFRPCAEQLEERALMASMTFAVNTFADELDAVPNATTSLREAVEMANANPGADTIMLPAGTYQLTLTGRNEDANQTGDLDISDDLTIIGAGSGSTFVQSGTDSWKNGNADGIDRVFDIGFQNVPAGISVNFQDFTIRYGQASFNGGGINFSSSGGNLALSGMSVEDNSAYFGGGVSVTESDLLTVDDSTILNNYAWDGAGIGLSAADGEITDSLIDGNEAHEVEGGGNGGGIYSYDGSLAVLRTTISNNAADFVGGGIYAESENAEDDELTITQTTINDNDSGEIGGGAYFRARNAGVVNSTISNNQATFTGGGFYIEDGEQEILVTFLNTTITLNSAQQGGGIYYSPSGGTVALGNTIVANNSTTSVAPAAQPIQSTSNPTSDSDLSGDFQSNGHNLIGVGDGSTGLVNGTNGDQVGSITTPIDPLLAALADNGGTTQTHRLRKTSPAIDNGSNDLAAGLQTDQRGVGFKRIEGDTVDVGAYEVPFEEPPEPPEPPKAVTIFVVGADDGRTSQPLVKVYNTKGKLQTKFLAYESSYRGGVRVAVGDVTGDGVPEIITAPGRLHSPLIKVFTIDGVEIKKFRIMAYAPTFVGGVSVAVGDVIGDGRADIIVGPSRGAPLVRVFTNHSAHQVDPFAARPSQSFYAYARSFIGGVTVAAGNLQGGVNTKEEVIVGTGSGVRSIVRTFTVEDRVQVQSVLHPFAASFRGGVFVAAGDYNGDHRDEIIVSTGQSGASRVKVFDGATGRVLKTFAAYGGPTRQAAVHIATIDLDGDGEADGILTGQANDGRTRAIRYYDFAKSELVDLIFENDEEFLGGVYLG